MGPKLANAVGLFIDGVRDGHLAAALDKYVGDHLIEHTPGVADDRAGLAAEFAPLIRHGRRTLRPLRGFEDGTKVFLHTVGLFGWRAIEQVRLDIFDTDGDDHLIEHWGVAAPLCNDSRSGHSQVDGPLLAEDLGRTAENKKIIESYVRGCLIDGDHRALPRYLSPDCYVDHDPAAPSGASDYCAYLQRSEVPRYTGLRQLVGCGNFVATFCEFDPAPLRAFDAAPIRAFDAAPIRAFDAAPLRPFDATSFRAFDPAPLRAFDPAPFHAFDAMPFRAFDEASGVILTADSGTYPADPGSRAADSGGTAHVGGKTGIGATAHAAGDLFRLDGGRIVEHWDVLA